MNFKYISVCGKIILDTWNDTKEKLIESAYCGTVTPICEIEGEKYWDILSAKEAVGFEVSMEEWIKYVCPKLEQIYANP